MTDELRLVELLNAARRERDEALAEVERLRDVVEAAAKRIIAACGCGWEHGCAGSHCDECGNIWFSAAGTYGYHADGCGGGIESPIGCRRFVRAVMGGDDE